jgi:hypothetical protein
VPAIGDEARGNALSAVPERVEHGYASVAGISDVVRADVQHEGPGRCNACGIAWIERRESSFRRRQYVRVGGDWRTSMLRQPSTA